MAGNTGGKNKMRERGRMDKEQSELMKRFKQSPLLFTGTVLVLVLVIVTFVFWGAGDWILPDRGTLSSDQLTFGYYDGKPIEYKPGSFFAQERESYMQYYSSEGLRGDYFNYQATQSAFQYAVLRTAMLSAMSKADYSPPQSLVDKKVAELPRYQENGVFSVLKYKQDDESTHLAIAKQVRENFITQRYAEDAAGSVNGAGDFKPAILIPAGEKALIADMAKVQRSFKLAVFPYSAYPDSEIVAFVEKNPALFKKVHLSQITIDSGESDAKKVLASIEKGTTNFEEAAKSQSKDQYADAGGDAGERYSYELENLIPGEDDRELVIALAEGALSPVVKTSAGWTIFRAESEAVPADTGDSVVLGKIRTYMTGSQRGTVEDYLNGLAAEFAADVAQYGFDFAAAKDSVKTESFGPLPVNYGNSPNFEMLSTFNVDALANAAENREFWRAAFSTPLKKCPEPLVLDDVVVIYPESESTDNTTAAENAQKYFETSFMQNTLSSSLRDAILKSDKFRDNFNSRYQQVFGKNSEN